MPCKVKANEKDGGYDIVGPGGKIEGHSDTLGEAQASCRVRNEQGKSKSKPKESDSDSE